MLMKHKAQLTRRWGKYYEDHTSHKYFSFKTLLPRDFISFEVAEIVGEDLELFSGPFKAFVYCFVFFRDFNPFNILAKTSDK